MMLTHSLYLLSALLTTAIVFGTPLPRANTTTTTTSTAPQATIYPGNGTQPVVITGVSEAAAGQNVFYGIPFGQPPVGSLRFARPKAATYNSTFNAIFPAPACLQNPGSTADAGDYGISEDCLTLNIYTPENAECLPVMVWVYGGGFVFGAASIYNGTGIVGKSIKMDQPVVFVAIQYRLGLFGWGYGEEILANGAANLGLRDITLALEWVRDNIWAFGGDPSKVTIFGESAGSIAISLLFLDESQSLFRGAIMESGAQDTLPLGPTNSTWQTPYDLIVSMTNCSTNYTTAGNQSSFDCLKALPATQLLEASLAVKEVTRYEATYIWGPSIDGDLIKASPFDLLAEGNFATSIPFISGNNKDEGTLFTPTAVNSTKFIVEYIDLLEPVVPDNMTIVELLTAYPNVPALGSPFGTGNNTFGLAPQFKQLAALFGDATFQSRRRYFLEQANNQGVSTWTYQFEGATPGAEPYLGVYHSSEIAYVFGIATVANNYTAGEELLGEAMMEYWINFASYLDPNGNPNDAGNSNLTYWSPHSYPQNKDLLQLATGNVTIIQDTYRDSQMSIFNGLAPQLGYRR